MTKLPRVSFIISQGINDSSPYHRERLEYAEVHLFPGSHGYTTPLVCLAKGAVVCRIMSILGSLRHLATQVLRSKWACQQSDTSSSNVCSA